MKPSVIETGCFSFGAVVRYVWDNMLGTAVGIAALCAVAAFVIAVLDFLK